MANTFSGMTNVNIATKGISAVEQALIPLSGFTTDYSTDAMQGTQVQTRVVAAGVAPTDLVINEGNDYDDVTNDSTTSEVTITLNNHPVTGYNLTDTQAQEINSGTWSDTSDKLITTYGRGIAKDVLDTSYALITESNFPNASEVGSASGFDSDDVMDIRGSVVNTGWDMDNQPVMVLNTDYYTALLKDNDLKNARSSGTTDPLQKGTLPTIGGFTIIEGAGLPFNDETLVGFVAQPDAIAIAMRGVDTQSRKDFLSFDIAVGPVTGAVITFATIFNDVLRRVDFTMEALHGASVAQSDSLRRIVTSANASSSSSSSSSSSVDSSSSSSSVDSSSSSSSSGGYSSSSSSVDSSSSESA